MEVVKLLETASSNGSNLPFIDSGWFIFAPSQTCLIFLRKLDVLFLNFNLTTMHRTDTTDWDSLMPLHGICVMLLHSIPTLVEQKNNEKFHEFFYSKNAAWNRMLFVRCVLHLQLNFNTFWNVEWRLKTICHWRNSYELHASLKMLNVKFWTSDASQWIIV